MLSRVIPDNFFFSTNAAKQTTNKKNLSLVNKHKVIKKRKKFKNYEEQIW